VQNLDTHVDEGKTDLEKVWVI